MSFSSPTAILESFRKEDTVKDLKKWLNPLHWLETAWNVFVSVLGSVLRLFGIERPMPRPAHDNIQPEDVDRAYHDAAAAEALPPTFGPPVDTAVNEFLRYVESAPEERAAFDLSPFDNDLQDFVLGLTEGDLEELRRRGPIGQITAALIRRIPPRLEMETAPVIPEPSKAELVREALLSHVRRRTEEAACGAVEFSPFAIR